MDKNFKTQFQIAKDAHEDKIVERYVELLKEYPNIAPWRIISLLSTEDVSIKTTRLSAQHIRKILIRKGVYSCGK